MTTIHIPLAVLLVASAVPPAMAEQRADSVINVVYECARGALLPVTYVNGAGGDSFAVVLIDGRLIGMAQVVSGSGVRYRATDATTPYELRGKGDEAMVLFGAEDAAEVILPDCHVTE